MRRFAGTVIIACGVAAVAFVAANTLAAMVIRIRERRAMNTFPPVATSVIFRNEPWGIDYWRDWRAGCRLPDRLRYTGDGVWHLRPFQSRTIHIGDDGLRRTEYCDCTGNATRIAMFGGSMLWGHGVPDGLTIPSLLAELFQRDGRPVCIRNYGEWGSTSDRALCELMRELRDTSRKPDVVIFYAGSYEVKEALFHAAGLRDSEIDTAIEEGEQARTNSSWIQNLPLTRLLAPNAHRFQPLSMSPAAAQACGSAAARQVINLQHELAALGVVHHFTPIVIWHPYAVAGGKPLSPDERENVDAVARSLPALKIAIDQAYAEMRGNREAGFYDLSDIFAGHRERLYIDAGHLTSAGNAIVAGRLHEIVRNGAPVFYRR